MSILINYYIFNNNDFLNNIYGTNLSVNDSTFITSNFDLLEEYKNELNLTTDIFFKTNILNMTENNIFFFILMPILLYTFIIVFSLVIEISSIRNNFIHFISFYFIILWLYIIFDVFLFNSLEYTTNYNVANDSTISNLTNLFEKTETILDTSIEIQQYNTDSTVLNYTLNFKKLMESFDFYGHFLLDQSAFWFVDYVYNVVEELNSLILFLNTHFSDLKIYLLTNFTEENLVYYFFNEITFNSFSIILIIILLFFISFLFLGFVDKFFINENKNFEFSWLLWLFLMASIFLFFSKTFIQIFICLECISFCSYILISLERYRKLSAISGVRYLVISAIPSVFLILGLIFMYKDFTSFDVDIIYNLFQTNLNIKYIGFYDSLNFYYNEFFTTYNLYNNPHIETYILNNDNVFVTKFFYNSLIDPMFLIINDIFPNLKYLFHNTSNEFKSEILELSDLINLSEQRKLDLAIMKQQLNLINLITDYSLNNSNLESFIYSQEYKEYIQKTLNFSETETLLFLDIQQNEANIFLGFGDLVHFIDLSGLSLIDLSINQPLDIEVRNFWFNYEKSLEITKNLVLNEIMMNNFVSDSFNNVILSKLNLLDFNALQHDLQITRLLDILKIFDSKKFTDTDSLEFYKDLILNIILNNFDLENTLYSDELFNLLGMLDQKDLRVFKFGYLEHNLLKNLLINFELETLNILMTKNMSNNIFTLNELYQNFNPVNLETGNDLFINENNFYSYNNYSEFLSFNSYLNDLRNEYLNSNFFNNLFSYEIVDEHVEIPEWFDGRFMNFMHWVFETYSPNIDTLYYDMHEFIPVFQWKENLRLTTLGLQINENLILIDNALNPNKLILDYELISEKVLIKETLNFMDYPLVNNNNNPMNELYIIENAIKLGENILLEEDFKNQTFVVSPFNGNIFETMNNVSINNNNNTKLALLPFLFMFNLNNSDENNKFNFLNVNYYNSLINNESLFFENSNFTFLSYFIISILLILVFLVINFSFKVTAAPFHIWAPTIYNEGTLSSVIFLSIFTKLALFLFAINLFDVYLGFLRETWIYIFLVLGLLSIVVGSFSAINERFIKKFFVYSSMIDVGFLFLAFSFFPNLQAYGYIFLYLFVYNLSSLIIWFFISYIRNDTKFLTNLISILNKSWPIQFIFSLVIFSMAGIPPFAGFFIKLNILIGLESSERNALVFLVLLFTVLSLFYYLRLIKIIQFDNISFNFYTNFVKPNVLFFASLFIFVLIFFIFLINQNLLVIFQEAFLTSKISDLQNLDQTLLNIEFDEDHWPQTINNTNDLGYWTFGRYLAFRKYWDEITLPNDTFRWIKDTLITLLLLSSAYFTWTYFKK